MTINPYSSPLADCSPVRGADEPDVRRQMRVVVRLYWWMGVIGIAAYSALAVGFSLGWSHRGEPLTAADASGLVGCAVAMAVFAASIHVANRLAARPQGVLRRARLVGIILATAWFPILTVPGLICVRRVTRLFAVYANLVSADANSTSSANTA